MAYLNYENKKGSGKKLKVHFDLPEDDDYPNSIHRHSTSSVSSDSSLDSDDAEEKDDNSIEYDGNVYGSPVWSFQGGSVTQSPPIQIMSPSGYDPDRIPSSVFARTTSPIEWSVASNESLFSIHLGNSSFTRDHAFAFNKSGELPRMSDLGSMPMTLPPVQEINHDKHVDMERHSVSSDSSQESAHLGVEDDHKIAETSAQVETTVLDKTPEDQSKEAIVPGEEVKSYASVSYRSVESDRSFHFPM